MRRIRRQALGTVVVLLLLAALLPGAARPVTASASSCQWQIEQVVTAAVTIYDPYQVVWTTVWYGITTFTDMCGSRYYRASILVLDGTPARLQLGLRIWVCGIRVATYSFSSLYATGLTFFSPAFYYGPCGRQADNWYSSSRWLNLGGFTHLWINQG
jgi:hypothetical protein